MVINVVLKRFEAPDEVRQMVKGKFEIVHIGGLTIGRATYEPGWKWSTDVGAASGESLCQVEHVGLVLEGRAAVKMKEGAERVIGPGDFFYVPPGHDSWVVGDEPYVSLHFLGGEKYAAD
ncbi:MAG: cupin domain-containing protein [Gemmatimonadaceae bacterium]